MSTIIAKATKEAADSKVGISLAREDASSPLIINNVNADSIFASSGLKKDMIVKEINGQSMLWKTPKEAAEMLRSFGAGVEISITAADAFVGEMTSAQASNKPAIAIMKDATKPGVFIRKIHSDGPLARTGLAPGQQLVSINGIPCPDDTKETIRVVQQAVGKLKFVAVPPPTEASAPSMAEERSPTMDPPAELEEAASATRELAASPREASSPRDATFSMLSDEEALDEPNILNRLFATCAC